MVVLKSNFAAIKSICTFLMLLEVKDLYAVQILEVKVPNRVKVGETVELSCKFDLEDKSLYSLNWWKSSQQFYQFSPAGSYHQTIYETPGIHVDKSKSSLKTVVLQNVSRVTSGSFKCEVVADFPSYERDSMSAPMDVVEVPRSPPVISIWRVQFKVGEKLRANCTSAGSIPAPNIIWYLNGKKILNRYTTNISPRRIHKHKKYHHKNKTGRGWVPPVKSHLSMELRPGHFVNGGRAILTCLTVIPQLYHSSSDVQITLPGVSPAVPSQRVSTSSSIHSSFLNHLLSIIFLKAAANLLSSTPSLRGSEIRYASYLTFSQL